MMVELANLEPVADGVPLIRPSATFSLEGEGQG